MHEASGSGRPRRGRSMSRNSCSPTRGRMPTVRYGPAEALSAPHKSQCGICAQLELYRHLQAFS